MEDEHVVWKRRLGALHQPRSKINIEGRSIDALNLANLNRGVNRTLTLFVTVRPNLLSANQRHGGSVPLSFGVRGNYCHCRWSILCVAVA